MNIGHEVHQLIGTNDGGAEGPKDRDKRIIMNVWSELFST